MKILVNRYYYSLADLAGVETGPAPIENVTDFNALIYKIQPFWAPGTPKPSEVTFFQDYFWPEFFDAPVVYIDKDQEPWGAVVEPTEDDIEEATTHLVGRLHRWYRDTYGKYAVLLDEFESIKEKLMGPVKIATESESEYQNSSETSGSNTGTVGVSGSNSASVKVSVDSENSSTASNSGMTDTSGSDSRSRSSLDNAEHKESDTPQSSVGTISEGYISKAAIDTASSSGSESGETLSSSQTEASSESASTSNSQTDTESSGENASTTSSSQANASQMDDSGSSRAGSVVKNDMDTAMARFREIQDKLDNLYGLWADEFNRFVIHSAE